jgi:GntR family transcriptional regulator, rspAB operon transcriptional repressor
MASPVPLVAAEGRFEVLPRSLTERAYERLVEKITRLELPPGALLIEKNLMEQLQIGRTPIREALQRLAIEGLVQHRLNRGMFVSEISAPGVQQIYEFRALIDGYAARLAAARASERQMNDLRGQFSLIASATEQSDVNAFVHADRGFYAVLAGAAQNVYLAEVIPRIFNLHLRLWFFISERRGSWVEIARAHQTMADTVSQAIGRRDQDEAEFAIKVYVSQRHRDIRELL